MANGDASEGRRPQDGPAAAAIADSESTTPPLSGSGSSTKARAVPHFTRAERAARGKAARAEVPRSSHAEIEFPKRRDPIALLEYQAASRVSDLVPIRHGRMLQSAFAFYRGGPLIIAADPAGIPQSGLRVQLCGDGHLSNFGVFGSPERNLVFDINDFDETAPGPWAWDVKRLATNFVVAGRALGFSDQDRRPVVLATARTYREATETYADQNQRDYEALTDAVDSGRLHAQAGL